MVSRRQTLRVAGSAVTVGLAGCSRDAFGPEDATAYELHVDRIATEPVPWALYEPDDGDLFGEPARTALDTVVPEGQYTTHGFVPVPEGSYVEHEGRYFRMEQFVTGRSTLERPVVRVESVDEEAVPDDAVAVDSLDQPSARPLKILHAHAVTDGASGAADLLQGDGYVMVRPAGRESRLATGLDGRIVTMTEDGAFAYRVDVRRERLTLTDHTVAAVVVAESRDMFREVVLGSQVDVDVETVDLPADARDLLDGAIARGRYTETGDPSAAFETLLRRLGFEVDEAETGRILWDAGSLFRASLYVSEAD